MTKNEHKVMHNDFKFKIIYEVRIISYSFHALLSFYNLLILAVSNKTMIHRQFVLKLLNSGSLLLLFFFAVTLTSGRVKFPHQRHIRRHFEISDNRGLTVESDAAH